MGLLQIAVVIATYSLGIYAMVISFILMNFIGLLIWYYFVHQLVGLRLRDVLKDILPYLAITLFSFGIAWLITRNIQNLYLLIVSKIVISAIIYIFVLKISHSVMFEESMEFLLHRKNKQNLF